MGCGASCEGGSNNLRKQGVEYPSSDPNRKKGYLTQNPFSMEDYWELLREIGIEDPQQPDEFEQSADKIVVITRSLSERAMPSALRRTRSSFLNHMTAGCESDSATSSQCLSSSPVRYLPASASGRRASDLISFSPDESFCTSIRPRECNNCSGTAASDVQEAETEPQCTSATSGHSTDAQAKLSASAVSIEKGVADGDLADGETEKCPQSGECAYGAAGLHSAHDERLAALDEPYSPGSTVGSPVHPLSWRCVGSSRSLSRTPTPVAGIGFAQASKKRSVRFHDEPTVIPPKIFTKYPLYHGLAAAR